jgi:Alpha/beta hydrolase domain
MAVNVTSPHVTASGVTQVDVRDVEDLGKFGAFMYERVRGIVRGVVGDEDVVGLDRLTLPYAYESEFEVLRPADTDARTTVLVDAENRGGPSVLGLVTGVQLRGQPPSASSYPAGMGPGCMFDTGISYARVQWQTQHCASVPDDAQGIGLVIVRDFGRWLAGDFARLVIGGASQSAWFVNTLVAEGFNVDPDDGSGVYDAALAYLSAGNWLALNRLADDGAPQYPYVRPARAPLTAPALLSRPESDPFYVDVTSYTEYYRLRGSVFASSPLPARARHYDVPAPHGPGSPQWASMVFASMGCNGGVEIGLNPIQSGPYVRALFTTLVSDPDQLPPSTWFDLGPAPEPSEHFHALPGTALQVPRVDGDAQPIGGVRLPDVELPTGRADPPALSPCGASSIDDGCGNFGGWQPFSAGELARRYGTVDDYLRRFAEIADGLTKQGFLLERDRDAVLHAGRQQFANAPTP